MKASDIRELGSEEMQRKVDELREELFNLQFQHQTGQLENPQKMKQTQKDIARIKTIIREVALEKKTQQV